MPNYLFDIRLNASIRLDAEAPEQARAMIREAFDGATVNAGSWPDGSPIMSEVSVAYGFGKLTDDIELVEVDGEAVDGDSFPPIPEWASPIQPGDTAAVFRTIRAAEAQDAAVGRIMQGFDLSEGPDQSVTVLMVRIAPDKAMIVGRDELELLSAELRDAIDAAKARAASSPGTPKEESTDV